MWSFMGLFFLVFFLLDHFTSFWIAFSMFLSWSSMSAVSVSHWTPCVSLSRILGCRPLPSSPCRTGQPSSWRLWPDLPSSPASVYLCPYQILLASSPGLICFTKLKMLAYTFTTRSMRVIIPKVHPSLAQGMGTWVLSCSSHVISSETLVYKVPQKTCAELTTGFL